MASNDKQTRAETHAWTLALIGAVLVGVSACGDNPTAIPDQQPAPHADQQTCVVIDKIHYCTDGTLALLRDTTRP